MISIIIPVYNAEHYLEQCLSSILRQTISDWECLLIDDGSTDKSALICDTWMQKDSRFKVYHQYNKGVSAARNVGLYKCVGEFICFVDSDDWVEDSYLSDMIACLDDSNRLIISGIITEDEDGSHLFCPSKELHVRFSTDPQSSEWIDYINLLYGPFPILFKKNVIVEDGLLFPENQSLGEDMVFNFNYFRHIDELLIIPKANYHYRRVNHESLSTIYRRDKFEIEYSLWKMRKSFFDEKRLWNKQLEEYMNTQLWGIVYNGIFNGPSVSCKVIESILSIPEISYLTISTFSASTRIKKAILNRDYLFFYLLRKIKG